MRWRSDELSKAKWSRLRYGFSNRQEDHDADKEDKPDEIIAKLRQVEVKAEMGEERYLPRLRLRVKVRRPQRPPGTAALP